VRAGRPVYSFDISDAEHAAMLAEAAATPGGRNKE
jgi:hypothetical protein